MEIVYEVKTDKTIDEAIESLEANLKEHDFGVLWKLNFKETLESKGLTFNDDYRILEVCNPKQAQKILGVNSQAGYVLPCKMAVRSEHGQTYMGMTSPKTLIGHFNNAELDQIAADVEATLAKAIEASV